MRLSNVAVKLVGRGEDERGVQEWTLRGTGQAAEEEVVVRGQRLVLKPEHQDSDTNDDVPRHANGVVSLDHAVVYARHSDVFKAWQAALGEPVRGLRTSERNQMAFFRFRGPLFAELVCPPTDDPEVRPRLSSRLPCCD